MIVSYNEALNEYTVNMEGAGILSKTMALKRDESMNECDCIANVVIQNAVYINPDEITVWNLIINKWLRKGLKKIRNGD